MTIEIEPIGAVRGGRSEPKDDGWGNVTAAIEIDGGRYGPEAVAGLGDFSHIEVVYHFHGVPEAMVETGARHPRSQRHWPKVGIFAQRGKNRPDRIGVAVCRLLKVTGLRLEVEGLDAIDGTPVLDVKPYLSGFAPRGAVREPDWAKEIMSDYW